MTRCRHITVESSWLKHSSRNNLKFITSNSRFLIGFWNMDGGWGSYHWQILLHLEVFCLVTDFTQFPELPEQVDWKTKNSTDRRESEHLKVMGPGRGQFLFHWRCHTQLSRHQAATHSFFLTLQYELSEIVFHYYVKHFCTEKQQNHSMCGNTT